MHMPKSPVYGGCNELTDPDLQVETGCLSRDKNYLFRE